MKRYALLLLLLVSLSTQAQTSINNYKYVLVPQRFEFSKEDNQYGLNEQLKSFLEQKGFSVYFDNSEIPKELAGDRCNALKAEVTQRKALFVTNLTILLKDCQGNIVFKSKEGKSREKEFVVAYGEALKDAYTSLNDAPYAYSGPANVQPRQMAQAAVVPVAQPAEATAAATAATKDASGTLYAQATASGYQLIDTTPKIVLTLLKTSAPDCFIANKGTAHGVVFKRNGEWLFEYYDADKLIAERLQIKF